MVYAMRDPEATGIPGIKTGLHELCHQLHHDLGGALNIMYELGSYAGASAAIFAQYFKVVHCVDPWKKEYEQLMEPLVEQMFDAIRKGCGNIVKHKCTAEDLVRSVKDGSLDFVYVDGGNHNYELAWGQMRDWWPKVRPHGFLGGHDFQPGFPAVEKAAARLLTEQDDAHYLQLFPDTSFTLQKKVALKWR